MGPPRHLTPHPPERWPAPQEIGPTPIEGRAVTISQVAWSAWGHALPVQRQRMHGTQKLTNLF